MEFWVILIIIGALVALIWLFSKWNGLKSKVLAVFLISLVLLIVFSVIFAFKGKDVVVKSLPDLQDAVQVYFSWIATAFSNVKTITTQTINMDWKGNQST